ncbi:uncharacterized protein LOC135841802 [Planococcus citri]|uniref:uncharacterized protein LOC135841802 n=1 Tax=Planococcus citri TaxID=170843 RepID=UPI0031F8BADA
MLKFVLLYFFSILLLNFAANPVSVASRIKKPVRNSSCDTAYDCSDFRMICLKNNTCACAKFHDWDSESKKCIANVTKISDWLKSTSSTVPETVSGQEDFKMIQNGDRITYQTKWAEYEGVKETGLGHVTRVIWPILLGLVVIFIVYGAILMEFL